jgi:hypothetical protein
LAPEISDRFFVIAEIAEANGNTKNSGDAQRARALPLSTERVGNSVSDNFNVVCSSKPSMRDLVIFARFVLTNKSYASPFSRSIMSMRTSRFMTLPAVEVLLRRRS